MPFHKSVLLASKVILWYYPIAVIKDMCSTKNRDPEAQSSIEALLGEIIDDKNKLEEVHRIDTKIAEIDDSIVISSWIRILLKHHEHLRTLHRPGVKYHNLNIKQRNHKATPQSDDGWLGLSIV